MKILSHAAAWAAARVHLVFISLLFGASGTALAVNSSDTPRDVSVSNSWTRATPAGSTVGVAYLTIVDRGRQSDTLVSLTSPVAAMVELHRTTVENGISRMRPAGQIVIAPGQSVKVQTGALHVMLMELKKPLVAGTKVPLVLQFRQAGAITVLMDVQPVTFAPQEEHTGH